MWIAVNLMVNVGVWVYCTFWGFGTAAVEEKMGLLNEFETKFKRLCEVFESHAKPLVSFAYCAY